MLLVGQKYIINFNKNEAELKIENPTHKFRDPNIVI